MLMPVLTASIYGTEQDKVNCSFYFKVSNGGRAAQTSVPRPVPLLMIVHLHAITLLHPSDWRLPTRRPMLAQAYQAAVLADHPRIKRLAEPKAHHARLHAERRRCAGVI